MTKRKLTFRNGWTLDDYRREILERSKQEIVRPDLDKPCRIWTGALTGKKGYGRLAAMNETRAHRVSYRVFVLNGESIENGLEVCHMCDNPPCVEPTHLHLGTHTQNMAEMHERYRASVGEQHSMATARGLRTISAHENMSKAAKARCIREKLDGTSQERTEKIWRTRKASDPTNEAFKTAWDTRRVRDPSGESHKKMWETRRKNKLTPT